MLWILTGIAITLILVGFFTCRSDDGVVLAIGLVAFLIFGITLCITLQCRHSTIHNNPAQIAVLEENNTKIQLVIEKYLNYEQGTLTSTKPFEEGNEVARQLDIIEKKLDIIEKNNKEIKERKLALVSLESYRIWLFMGEPRK